MKSVKRVFYRPRHLKRLGARRLVRVEAVSAS